ncbi:transglycosylase SLT domain-containing protein [Almyronema epifaneia S1]|uniref:Transglycosylase SLT domain-containing protein n=2 Tax=Almyronema TaxID=3114804 RepID=A0ABW6I991_9CYAN
MPLLALVGVSTLSLSLFVGLAALIGGWGWFNRSGQLEAPLAERTSPESNSQVLKLVSQPAATRATQLMAIAQSDSSSLEQARARYLLATDLINQGRGGTAIELLTGLADEYPTLAPYVWVKQGQAQAAAGQTAAAEQTWQQAVERYGDQPAIAEALFQLGKTEARYWDQALAKFPAHPRSVEIARQRLADQSSGDQTLALLLQIAQHGLYLSEIETYLDRLVAEYGSQLQPADWQTIGFGYWEIQRYGKAGSAYAQAPASPRNLYRTARGLQLGEQKTAAIAAYQQLAAQFPTAPETAEGLIKLANLLPQAQALPVIDRVIANFPDYAAEALMLRARDLESLDSPDSAAQARQSVLTQYSNSEAAAELRWQYAENAAAQQDLAAAYTWARQLLAENAESELASKAAFWAGKWAQRLGQSAAAQLAFEQTVQRYPESYYAWRAAVSLGWPVGDFQTVRSQTPEITQPAQRSLLPAGSPQLQELYQLGQDQDAWSLWQSEFTNLQDPSVTEQFTDGLMRLGVGDNLDGIFMVSSLAWRDRPAEKSQYTQLKQQDAYRHALYPFPFAEIIEAWASQQQLNPLLVTALIRQESRFEPQIRSYVGAVGLMQVMPDTADWIQAQTGFDNINLEAPSDNVKLGTWYLDYTHSEYGDNSLFAVASYNAGPGNVADWISRNNFADLDEFVERIPFPETRGYVDSVFGGYWNYLQLYSPAIAQLLQSHAKKTLAPLPELK